MYIQSKLGRFMKARIQTWGNSLGLRIPMQIAKELDLHQGSSVTLEIEDNRIIIQPCNYSLESMLEQITPDNLHHLEMDDVQKGNEEW